MIVVIANFHCSDCLVPICKYCWDAFHTTHVPLSECSKFHHLIPRGTRSVQDSCHPVHVVRRPRSVTPKENPTPASTCSATHGPTAPGDSRRSRSITRQEASTPGSTRSATRGTGNSRHSHSITRQEASTPASTRSAPCAASTPASTRSATRGTSSVHRCSHSITRQEASTPTLTRSAPRATPARSVSAQK